MEYETILALFNETAFPIAVSVALFYIVHGTLKTQNKALTELEHSIKNNTYVIQQLSEKLDNVSIQK